MRILPWFPIIPALGKFSYLVLERYAYGGFAWERS